jgi:hypothetical protein
MEPRLPTSATFVVQYSRDADLKRQKVCGRVEHVSSGRSVRFDSQTELDRFVIQVLCKEEKDRKPTDDVQA